MVIVCKDADFSTSGLGKIRYKTSTETELFATYLTRSLTADQKLGLDTFVDGLKLSGAWDNIQQLYIPMISYINGDSTALLNSFIDIKQSYTGGTMVKNTYATNNILQNNYKFANKGIERLTTVSNYLDLSKMFRVQNDITTLTSKNSHFLIYKLNGTHISTPIDNSSYFGYNYSETLKSPNFNQSSDITIRVGTASVSSYNGVSLLPTSTNVLIGYSAKDGIINKKGDIFSTFNNSAESEFILNNPLYFGSVQLNVSIGLVSIGYGLTTAQLTDFNSALVVFASNF